MKETKIDKARLKDVQGRFLTQALFIEHYYDPKFAVFSFKDEDFMYEGVLYPSLKRLYLEVADPTEYQFAKKYLGGWEHWRKMVENKALMKEIELWREELEVSLRSAAVIAMMDMTENFQAQKFLAERAWEKGTVGRPKKVDTVREANIKDQIDKEFNEALTRMNTYEKKVA